VTASVAQLDRAGGFYPPGCGFDSCRGHKSGVLAVDLGAGRSAARATVRQGAFEDNVFVIVEGEADVIIDGSSVGKAVVGEIVGDLSMLGTGKRAATLRAITPMHVLVFDPPEIDSVLSADPSSSRRLSQHGEQAGS
jgi:CRP-like cAMP-binding protein